MYNLEFVRTVMNMHDTDTRVLMWVRSTTNPIDEFVRKLNLQYMKITRPVIDASTKNNITPTGARYGKTSKTKLVVTATVRSFEWFGSSGYVVVTFAAKMPSIIEEHVHRVWLLQRNQRYFSGFRVERKRIKQLTRLVVVPDRSTTSALELVSGSKRTLSAPTQILAVARARDGDTRKEYVIDEIATAVGADDTSADIHLTHKRDKTQPTIILTEDIHAPTMLLTQGLDSLLSQATK